jgi:paraquat-inducible protein A
LASRVPQSSQKTWAWLIAAVVLYVPANVLPVMHTSGVLGTQDSTILEGVESFVHSGSWDIALLIFAASVLVPVTKFLAIAFLLMTVSRGSRWATRERTKLYRIVEFIGYWSMLDVVVIALTASLIQFNSLGTAEPRLGIAFFCAVVVLTMVAARSFDPRLLWDDR